MKKQFFFTYKEQFDLIQALQLDSKHTIGVATYMCKINMIDTECEFIIVLVLCDSGVILNKWMCMPDTDPIIIYENTTNKSHPVTCRGPGDECDDSMDECNIMCYLCEQKKPDDLW